MPGRESNNMNGTERPPGWRSWLAVTVLLGEVLLEGIKLPFRLVLFLFNRKSVAAGIKKTLTGEG
jgi:hypothetical protein